MARNSKEVTFKEEKINIEEIKNELKDYVDLKIKNSVDTEVINANKKLLKEKNKRLLFKNIVIIILLVVIGFLIYILYNENYFSKNKEIIEVKNNTVIEEEVKEEEKKEEITLEKLISKYSYLLDKINISEESEYINDFYSGNLSKEVKSYLAFNNVNFDELIKEEDYIIFDSDLLKNEYEKIFGHEIENVSFNYNKNKIRYISKLSSYVSDSIINKSNSNINREITNIVVEDNTVKITCVEGIIKEEKLYNSITLNEIENYKKGNISNYKSDLNTITYVFENEKLINIK